jgi:NAD(P)-dependent dehydrogenase (short-subunit alcohol dehydrogenase family)
VSTTARVLIIGASRGLGQGFVEHYRAQGAEVIATVRDEAARARLVQLGASVMTLDLLDEAALARAARSFGGERLTLVVFNAGVTGPRAPSLDAPADREAFDRVMHTNVHAALTLARPLIESLVQARGTLAFLTSRMGSIGSVAASGSALYRVSKAAENMVARLAHLEAAPKGVRVLALHPGWVRTDMGGQGADIDIKTSIAGMTSVLADGLRYPSGGFFDYRGETIVW